jgi:putative component of membrane protein insertase Oxa1/YidC/SpoIIIJ protein YidD
MKNIVLFLIRIYQVTLSPDHGLFRGLFPHGFCPYYPSCSEYTRQAVIRFGLFRGLFRGGVRVARCNPFTVPRVDVV